MKLIKNIGFIILLFVSISQSLGNATSVFQATDFATECQEGTQTDGMCYLAMELDDCEDENASKVHVFSAYILLSEDNFNDRRYQFHPSFHPAFWQPPRIS